MAVVETSALVMLTPSSCTVQESAETARDVDFLWRPTLSQAILRCDGDVQPDAPVAETKWGLARPEVPYLQSLLVQGLSWVCVVDMSLTYKLLGALSRECESIGVEPDSRPGASTS